MVSDVRGRSSTSPDSQLATDGLDRSRAWSTGTAATREINLLVSRGRIGSRRSGFVACRSGGEREKRECRTTRCSGPLQSTALQCVASGGAPTGTFNSVWDDHLKSRTSCEQNCGNQWRAPGCEHSRYKFLVYSITTRTMRCYYGLYLHGLTLWRPKTSAAMDH